MEKTIEQLEQDVLEVLRDCYDPEIPVNIYDLGLIYEININEQKDVNILMTLTSPSCPVAETLPPDVESRVGAISGLHSAKVELTFDPPWEQSMMSEEAKLELGFL